MKTRTSVASLVLSVVILIWAATAGAAITPFDELYDSLKADETGVRLIDYEQFTKLRASGDAFVLVDVLTPESFAKGHIPGAVNFPLETINATTAEEVLGPGAKIVVYCGSFTCPASSQAASQLAALGYAVLDYKGGLKNWQLQGNALESTE